MRFNLVHPALCVVVVLSGAIPCYAQTQAAPAGDASMRSETREVLIDTIVSGRKNTYPLDLTQKNFRVFEDGKEQKITGASLESTGVSQERPRRHYIVLFFDTTTLTTPNLLNLRRDVGKFIDQSAGPDRYMAIIMFDRSLKTLQNFTPDPQRLKAALELVRGFGVTAATVAPAAGGGGKGGRGGGDNASDGAIDALNRGLLDAVASTAASLAPIRGRKALVMFSAAGSIAQNLPELDAAISACNNANVAVYSMAGGWLIGELAAPANRPGMLKRTLEAVAAPAVQWVQAQLAQTATAPDSPVFGFQRGGGSGSANLSSADGTTPMESQQGQSEGLGLVRMLADGTGGAMMVAANDLPAVLGAIVAEQENYYLLAYTPAIASADGTCHKVLVKVDKSGTDVRSRKSYCTAKSADPLNGKAVGQELETKAEGVDAGNIPAKLQLPWFYASPNFARVDIVMDLMPGPLKLQKDKNRLHGELNLLGVAYRPDGSVAGRFSDSVKLDFDSQQQADVFEKTPFHYASQFQMPPGQYNFRMAIGTGDQGFGKVETPLDIAPWTGKTISMSGLALSHSLRPSTSLTAGLDESLAEAVHTLVVNGTEVVPTAASQFHTSEKGYFYFEVYDPALAAAAPAPPFELHVRILDRSTGQPKDDSGAIDSKDLVRPGNPMVPVVLALPTTRLPAGAYKLEVSVIDAAGKSAASRTTDFDVN